MKGYFRKRGNSWSYTIDIGRDPSTGIRKQKSRSGFKTKKEAQKSCAELISEYENGLYIEASEQKLSAFLNDWHNNYSKQVLKPTTFGIQSLLLDKHIIPALGQVKLKDLSFAHVRDFYQLKMQSGLSPRTVKRMHDVLRAAMNKAMEWEMIHKNVVAMVSPPRIPDSNKQTWTIEEANRFLNAVKNERISIIYVIAIYTGMRMGEILGLRWRDVDFEAHKFSLRQSVGIVEGKLVIDDLKTKGSKRNISVPENVMDELKRHRVKQLQEKLIIGRAYEDKDLVNCSEIGNPIWPNNLRRHYNKWIEKSEVPKIRFHDLRHTHATIMLQIGEHPKIISERLGHSRTGVLLDIYSHVLPDMQKNSSDNFANAMKRSLK